MRLRGDMAVRWVGIRRRGGGAIGPSARPRGQRTCGTRQRTTRPPPTPWWATLRSLLRNAERLGHSSRELAYEPLPPMLPICR